MPVTPCWDLYYTVIHSNAEQTLHLIYKARTTSPSKGCVIKMTPSPLWFQWTMANWVFINDIIQNLPNNHRCRTHNQINQVFIYRCIIGGTTWQAMVPLSSIWRSVSISRMLVILGPFQTKAFSQMSPMRRLACDWCCRTLKGFNTEQCWKAVCALSFLGNI